MKCVITPSPSWFEEQTESLQGLNSVPGKQTQSSYIWMKTVSVKAVLFLLTLPQRGTAGSCLFNPIIQRHFYIIIHSYGSMTISNNKIRITTLGLLRFVLTVVSSIWVLFPKMREESQFQFCFKIQNHSILNVPLCLVLILTVAAVIKSAANPTETTMNLKETKNLSNTKNVIIKIIWLQFSVPCKFLSFKNVTAFY